MKNPIGFDGFIQIALVVRDIEKAAEAWAKLFGVPKPEIKDSPPGPKEGVTYRGKPASYGLKMAVINVGSFVIELHEVDKESDSTFGEFIDKHGNGVHHLGFEVGERRDAIIEELGALGYGVRQVGFIPEAAGQSLTRRMIWALI